MATRSDRRGSRLNVDRRFFLVACVAIGGGAAIAGYALLSEAIAGMTSVGYRDARLVIGAIGSLTLLGLTLAVLACSTRGQPDRPVPDVETQLRRAREQATELAERVVRSVGADLHDGPAQLLGMALLLLPEEPEEAPASDTAPDLSRVRSVITEALQEIRAISAGSVLPEIDNADLEQVIRLAVQAHMRRTSTEVVCVISLSALVASRSAKICVYRFIQEALNNSFKHAGAKGQRVAASANETLVEITVSDLGPGLRGRGTESNDSQMGMIVMRDRIGSLGGALVISSDKFGLALTARFELATPWCLGELDEE
ncbi:MAG: hypothetical protein SFW09_10320 [Hyphomicrobiaceae bacterium]|nr:hypothetical protein [Hyphomicrobiaceae bacterium]